MIGPVRKAIVHLPIRLKGNLKYNSGNLLSPLGDQNKDLGAALQTRRYKPGLDKRDMNVD